MSFKKSPKSARQRLLMYLFAIAWTGWQGTLEAQATSGPGCLYVVNVANWDALNMRARPSAKSRIVDYLKPGQHGIIRLERPCVPLSRPWAQRWCPVTHYSGYDTMRGWVKARYVRDSHCP
ncbi:SH3 domain-containing protein [Cohaesibacter sp. ES.047]|uniref:SH3 domain-containing protein n=1 Tax=Cohaesibacter sp. ES.047 TaxID=1798205 RepID=UPI000BC0337C|nr:SH3 domain-containing protein [Cohaesibacter sp. ES.047]SNY92419.1 SH3 domain-containing protein [Cohaesibacter sp. ES.047]